MSKLLDQINERKAILEIARTNLKKHFIGLDDQVDRVINTIETWFIMPDLITRPVIVNIWGMTGTGKTDLIRRLSRELGMLNKFFELQMDTKKCSWVRTIEDSFDVAGFEEGEPAIVLFDELQRFSTKDSMGDQIDNDVYQDIWMLLSDGKFANQAGTLNKVQELLLEQLFEQEREKRQKENEEKRRKEAEKKGETLDAPVNEDNQSFLYKSSYWRSKSFKKKLKLRESVEDIMKWTPEQKMEKIKECAENDSIAEGSDYSKLLIFVCGNLDKAYSMANNVTDGDIDADTFHEFSKKINLADIKSALLRKFAPEQIARLGNNHIIYPALSEANFREFIKRNVNSILKSFEEISNVKINTDCSIYDTIYRNGVFPAQGVRPVFTTISSLIESNIPSLLLAALEKNVSEINISFQDSHIIAFANESKIASKKVKLDFDDVIKSKDKSKVYQTAVHEAGHVVLYTKLLGIAPTQVNSVCASNRAHGFMASHHISNSKDLSEKLIAIYYGGRAAEIMVFGKDMIGAGASGDINSATSTAAAMVRDWEFDSHFAGRISQEKMNDYGSVTNLTNVAETNDTVSEVLSRGYDLATEVLEENSKYHLALTEALIEKTKLTQDDVAKIAMEHNIEARCEDSSYVINSKYIEKFEKYKTQTEGANHES